MRAPRVTYHLPYFPPSQYFVIFYGLTVGLVMMTYARVKVVIFLLDLVSRFDAFFTGRGAAAAAGGGADGGGDEADRGRYRPLGYILSQLEGIQSQGVAFLTKTADLAQLTLGGTFGGASAVYFAANLACGSCWGDFTLEIETAKSLSEIA